MAPVHATLDLDRRTIIAASPNAAVQMSAHVLLRRSLSVDSTQRVTLGVIIAYAVIIALLWNLPYVRWSLWPFKVRPLPSDLLTLRLLSCRALAYGYAVWNRCSL